MNRYFYSACKAVLLMALTIAGNTTVNGATQSSSTNQEITTLTERYVRNEPLSTQEKIQVDQYLRTHPGMLPHAPNPPRTMELDSTGGPDGFGYRFIDSNSPGGPTFNWIDITSTGTNLGVSGDDAAAQVPLGTFSFPFYGTTVNQSLGLYAATNGQISIGISNSYYGNSSLPTSNLSAMGICPWWADMYVTSPEGVYYQDMGDGRLVIEFILHGFSSTSYLATFEAVLYSDGRILFQYNSVSNPDLSYLPTVGIQGATAGSNYLAYIQNTRLTAGTLYPAANTAILFYTLGEAANPVPLDSSNSVPINVTMQWSTVLSAVGYNVLFGTTNPPTTEITHHITTPSCIPPTLSSSTTYFWQVIALADTSGTTTTTGPVWTFTTGTGTAPNAPSNAIIDSVTDATTTSLHLHWTSNSSGTESGFYIDRSTNGINFNRYDSVGMGITQYLNTGLNVNTRYWYRVYSYNSNATSANFASANAFTLANIPGAPSLSGAGMHSNSLSFPTTSNPVYTQYAIQEPDSGLFVQPSGFLGFTPSWQTLGQWGIAVTVRGLTTTSLYRFNLEARNGANVPTPFGASDTISTNSGLSGTKTIGGNNPDFVTIQTAIDAANQGVGVSGVTFLIRGGVYNENPDSITDGALSSATNPILFKPADTLSVTINVTGTAQYPYAYKFYNADYITFDGGLPQYPDRRFITVNAVGTFGTQGFCFSNGSDFCCVKNCVITVPGNIANTSYNTIRANNSLAQTPATVCNSDSIINNRLTGGYYSVYLYGIYPNQTAWSNWYIAGNQIVDFYYMGVYTAYVSNAVIKNNEIYRTSAGLTTVYGIYSTTTINVNNVFDGNWIHDLSSTATGTIYGMYMFSGPNKLISNNMINIDPNTSGTVYGIYLGSDQSNLINNTVRIGGVSGSVSANSYALYLNATTTQDTFANNILINQRSGGTSPTYYNTCFYNQNAYSTSLFAYSDHNLFTTVDESPNDNHYVARYATNTYNTLLDLRQLAGYNWDVNSSSIPPTFVGVPNLHINTSAPTPVESAGIYFATVPRDFDSDVRNTSTPDIGCDEGNFVTAGDLIHPNINFTFLRTWDTNSARVFSAYITDNVGVAAGTNRPRVYYKRSTDANWSFAASDSSYDSTYFFTIPGYSIGTRINYYLAAQDTSSNVVTYPFGGSGANPPGATAPPTYLTYLIQTLLNGIKTIGGTNPDYLTIQAAIDALNAAGTDTGVTFLIRGGTYTESPDSITVAAQSAQTAPVLFKPADTLGITINVTGTAQFPYAYKIFNASYVTFDGGLMDYPGRRFITVNATGATGYYGFWLANGSSYCCIKNCIITTTANNTGLFEPIRAYNNNLQTGGNCNYDSLINNQIVGGFFGIYLNGLYPSSAWTNWYIVNNQIEDFYEYGIYFSYIANSIFKKNEIFRTAASASTYSYGFYSTSSQSTDDIFDSNWLHDLTPPNNGNVYAMYLYYGTNKLITNNMVDVSPVGGGYTIGIEVGADQSTIIGNTVHIGGTASATGNSMALYIGVSTTSDSIANNILINERTGNNTGTYYNTCLYLPGSFSSTSFAYSDYNILTNVVENEGDNCDAAWFGADHYNSLTALRQALIYNWDVHSLPYPVTFVGIPDLHISSAVGTPVESAGHPFTNDLRDFDGQLRNATTPDIGCDEGNFRMMAFGTISGVVRDSTPSVAPIAGAIIHAGRYIDSTDANGAFTMSVLAGTYNLRYSADFHASDSTTVIVDSAQTDTLTIWMYHPGISTDPTSIEILSGPGQMHSTTLTITNAGNADLHWHGEATSEPHGFDRNHRIGNGSAVSPIQLNVIDSRTRNSLPKVVKSVSKSNALTLHIPNKANTRLPVHPMSVDELDSMGGPDSSGYRFYDSNAPNGPTFDWIEINTTGTALGTNWTGSTDDGYQQIPLGTFSFPFYGITIDQSAGLYASTDGQITVGSGSEEYVNEPLPSTALPARSFALFWCDNQVVSPQAVYYEDMGDGRFVVEYNFSHLGGTGAVVCEAIFYSDGRIIYQYQSSTLYDVSYLPTVGIQGANTGSNALSYASNTYGVEGTFYPTTGLAILFQNSPPWLTISPTGGIVAPHQPAEIFIQATIDSNVTLPASWSGLITIMSDANPHVTNIPVTVTITDAAHDVVTIPYRYKLYQNYPNPFNPTTEIRFDLQKEGMTRLTIFDVTGRQVAKLVNQELPAGSHSVRFEAPRLATGVYFYRLQSGGFTDVKKMIMVK